MITKPRLAWRTTLDTSGAVIEITAATRDFGFAVWHERAAWRWISWRVDDCHPAGGGDDVAFGAAREAMHAAEKWNEED